MQKIRWKCRIAPSLGGGFEGTPQGAWGVEEYKEEHHPTVFFGLYGLPDFYALWKHKGNRSILWAGSDITNFVNGYWLDDVGKIRLEPKSLVKYINEYCESWVENGEQFKALSRVGLTSFITPSFLGKVEDYEVSYKWDGKIKLYTSVSGDDFKLYGWDKISELAIDNPNIEFHLYGNNKSIVCGEDMPEIHLKNLFFHGRVPQEQMNEETKKMSGALRLTKMDGFSEILAKSILWGQWPISPHIDYPHMLKDIKEIYNKKEPNIEGRNYYLKILNRYPWNTKS